MRSAHHPTLLSPVVTICRNIHTVADTRENRTNGSILKVFLFMDLTDNSNRNNRNAGWPPDALNNPNERDNPLKTSLLIRSDAAGARNRKRIPANNPNVTIIYFFFLKSLYDIINATDPAVTGIAKPSCHAPVTAASKKASTKFHPFPSVFVTYRIRHIISPLGMI